VIPEALGCVTIQLEGYICHHRGNGATFSLTCRNVSEEDERGSTFDLVRGRSRYNTALDCACIPMMISQFTRSAILTSIKHKMSNQFNPVTASLQDVAQRLADGRLNSEVLVKTYLGELASSFSLRS
jgi:hypothetical protein